MKTAVLYASMTGHSKKLAHAIGEACNIEVFDAKAGAVPPPVDLLFVVGGVYGGQPDPALLAAAQQMTGESVKRVAMVVSATAPNPTLSAVEAALTANGVILEPQKYSCKGSFLFLGWGHPNRAELEGAVAYARRLTGEA